MNPSCLASAAVAAVVLGCSLSQAGPNMIGRQSQNEGILVLPAPARVTVDGDLGEWDWTGRIWSFADSGIRNRYSAETAAMWDKENLYVGLKWKDPTPMYSTVDPAFNPTEGWKSDSVQIRLRTDRFSHLTTWFFAPREMPVVHVDYGRGLEDPFGGGGGFWVGKEHATAPGRGIEMAYRKDEDGKGYTQEIKIPWVILHNEVPDHRPGDRFQMGFEYLWGDPTGRTWPVHRYADNMRPGATSREFYFTSWKSWGDAELVDRGNVTVRQYVDEASRLAGTIPIRLSIPQNSARVTVVIEDGSGRRVRNLAADLDPADYTLEGGRGVGRIEIRWDGLDDDGRLVAPGRYEVRGLTHQGLSAEYSACFYNPGTPPWAVKDGSGAWGADHSAPNGVAAAGDRMVVTWPFAEGGSGIIGLDTTGRKQWGEKRGMTGVAADAQYAYGAVAGTGAGEFLCRFDAKTGMYRPFVLDGKPRVFDLPLADIFKGGVPGKVTGMAVKARELVLAMSEGRLAVLEATSARLLRQIDVPAPGHIAFGKDGRLVGIFAGKLHSVNLETGELLSVATPDLGVAGAVAVDPEDNVVIADLGPDSQVKAYSPSGKLVYTVGRKGGRPVRGAFDEQAMVRMSSVAVDSEGRIWVVESWDYPRRVSTWGKDGRLIRDYLGNTGYAGANSYLHDQDPTLGYCGPMEFKLDRATGRWSLTRVLWVPDAGRGEGFALDVAANVIPQRFTSSASGKPREYLYTHERGHVVFMERNGDWQPVAAVCRVADITGSPREAPTGEMAGLSAADGCFWNDLNADGRVQRSECTILPARISGQNRASPPFAVDNGWGGRIAPDLSFYSNGLLRFRPTGFSADGAPQYGPAAMQAVGIQENGDLVPVIDEHLLLCLSFKGYAGPTTGMLGIDDRTGTTLWSYPNPYPGVHGSHAAPMPKPGLLIGPLKILGLAKVDERIGNVFVMRGNLGQDFFMTTDGLFVGALFQDCRLPGDALPDKESLLEGMPMEGFSNGSEPFNGWFGRQADGKIRLTTGMAREACMILEVKGLDSIRRFKGQSLELSPATLAKADAENTARTRATAGPRTYAVRRLEVAPRIDGDAPLWKEVSPLAIGRAGQPDKGTAKLAYDATHLHVLFDVADSTPWRNEGKDYTRLFKTGDAVDVQLRTDPNAKAGTPQAGDLRVVFANFRGRPTAVLMMPVDPTAPEDRRVTFHSPVGRKDFDRVEILPDAIVRVRTEGGRYVVEAAIPLGRLNLAPRPGMVLRGDLGFISSDATGMINTARTYWANPAANLVSDLPLEAWLYPDTWGDLTFE